MASALRTRLIWRTALIVLLAIAFTHAAGGCKEEGLDLSLVVTRVQGEVSAERGGQKRALRIGDRLDKGDVIVTGPTSLVDLRSGKIGVFRIKENARVEVAELTGRLEFKQDSGRSLFAFDQLEGRTEVQVRTPTVVAAVRGTSFAVAVGELKARIAVLSGAVLVQQGEQSVAVEALQEVESAGDGELEADALSRDAKGDLREIVEIESIGELSEFAEIQNRLTDMDIGDEAGAAADRLPPRTIREER